jgi:hypothetical protein
MSGSDWLLPRRREGTAFGLFGLSHLEILLGLSATLNVLLIVIRTLAYLLVAYALFLAVYSKSKQPSTR